MQKIGTGRRRLLIRAGAVLGALAALAPMQARAQAQPVKMRVSLDTTAVHFRTKAIERYLAAVKERSKGQIEPTLYHSAQLFRDRDVLKALRQGGVEMAVPGTWQLAAVEPGLDLFQLPMFYGMPAAAVHKVADGEVGQALAKSLEAKAGVKVLGAWLDLGPANTFTTKRPINGIADMAKLTVRTPGGKGLIARIQQVGGVPNMTAWPDVPLALSQGNFDALVSTNESVVSAKLWDAGVRYAFEDNQFFGQYIPMVSEAFWNKLSAEQRRVLEQTWAEMLPGMRAEGARAQEEAKATLASHGVAFVTPKPETLAEIRARFMPTQAELARQMNVEPAMVEKTAALLAAK
jgi:C4-dicarboxylate-binding protein DctP